MKVVNVKEKLSLFRTHWSPKIIGDLNDSHIKVAKLKGEFVWHDHANEDELFLVVKGKLTIKLRKADLKLGEGDFVVIPKGVEHKPVAEKEVHVILIEPKTTINTGAVKEKRTVAESGRI
ncbi:MAG: cupin domain-containing protein [archaeon]